MVQIMRETNHGTIRMFEINGIEVIIIETDKMFDAWIHTAPINEWGSGSGGIATSTFGMPKKQSDGTNITFDKFLEYVINDLEEYMYEYKEELDKLDNIDLDNIDCC